MGARPGRPLEPVPTTVCPRCNTAGPARLFRGEACAACKAQEAWAQLDGEKLVIDRGTIDSTVLRRQGEAAGVPVWRRMLVWIGPAITVALATAAVWSIVQLLSSRAIGPLATVLSDLSWSWKQAVLIGSATFIVSLIALVRAKRSRHFRRIPLLASHLLAIVIGASAIVWGALNGIAMTQAFGGQYTSMPPRESLGVTTQLERIVDATVVVLAPDADGDVRGGAIGTGAVVAADAHRAWIVTCSHVAIPYITPGAPRKPSEALPVWVQLADGREGQGRVKWAAPPPLDIVLVELAIDHPPAPVPIASDTSELSATAAVTFVPNPYRSGWKVLHGEVLKRERHLSPAGAYDLVLTSLPVTHGDSGSGLYDGRGQLVGLNTWTRISDGPAEGLSLPSEAMRAAIDAIRSNQLEGGTLPALPVGGRSPGIDQLEHAE